jgi:hypothetical protein
MISHIDPHVRALCDRLHEAGHQLAQTSGALATDATTLALLGRRAEAEAELLVVPALDPDRHYSDRVAIELHELDRASLRGALQGVHYARGKARLYREERAELGELPDRPRLPWAKGLLLTAALGPMMGLALPGLLAQVGLLPAVPLALALGCVGAAGLVWGRLVDALRGDVRNRIAWAWWLIVPVLGGALYLVQVGSLLGRAVPLAAGLSLLVVGLLVALELVSHGLRRAAHEAQTHTRLIHAADQKVENADGRLGVEEAWLETLDGQVRAQLTQFDDGEKGGERTASLRLVASSAAEEGYRAGIADNLRQVSGGGAANRAIVDHAHEPAAR